MACFILSEGLICWAELTMRVTWKILKFLAAEIWKRKEKGKEGRERDWKVKVRKRTVYDMMSLTTEPLIKVYDCEIKECEHRTVRLQRGEIFARINVYLWSV